jgi:hypothetical protein
MRVQNEAMEIRIVAPKGFALYRAPVKRQPTLVKKITIDRTFQRHYLYEQIFYANALNSRLRNSSISKIEAVIIRKESHLWQKSCFDD